MSSIRSKASKDKQRKDHRSKYSFSKLMSHPDSIYIKEDVEISPPTRDEVKCVKCGFKARYQFIRCPECNEVQE